MKKTLTFLALFFIISNFGFAKSAIVIKITTNKKKAVYKIGEKAKFTVTITDNGKALKKGTATYNLFKGEVSKVSKGTLKFKKPSIISASLSEPGFILLEVSLVTADNRSAKAFSGMAFSPKKIKPSKATPKDFKKFWQAKIKAQNKLVMKPVLVKVNSKKEVEAFDIKINSLGKMPVSGYFGRPLKKNRRRKLPAILRVHGAGVSSSALWFAEGWAMKGALALDINAHGIENGKDKSFYANLKKTNLKGYQLFDKNNRQKSYFLGMLLRVSRALEFLKAQPEWDGKTLVILGHSQGGGQALFGAGLDKQVSAIAVSVPALCDHTGVLKNRLNGWPNFLGYNKNSLNTEVLKTAPYFDSVNFAKSAKASALFAVGFIDRTCPPSTVYAAFNAYNGQKKIVNMINTGHATSKEYYKIQIQFLKESMGL